MGFEMFFLKVTVFVSSCSDGDNAAFNKSTQTAVLYTNNHFIIIMYSATLK